MPLSDSGNGRLCVFPPRAGG
jgi:hypothetical protein